MKSVALVVVLLAVGCASCASNQVVVHDPQAKQTEAEYREIAARHAAYGNSQSSREWSERADETAKRSEARGGLLEKLLDTLVFNLLNAAVGK
jgi:hypothetical protein